MRRVLDISEEAEIRREVDRLGLRLQWWVDADKVEWRAKHYLERGLARTVREAVTFGRAYERNTRLQSERRNRRVAV